MVGWRISAIGLTLLLSGCAGPLYWHEPPQPAADQRLEGSWQGLVRNGSLQHYARVGLTPAVRVRCAQYRDLIRLQVDGNGQVEGTLGRSAVVRFTTTLDRDGRFAVALPVEGDTWIWGGVMLWGTEHAPLLVLQGQLDGRSGLGQGWLNVSPNEPRLGCAGRFEVSRNAQALPQDVYGAPFEIRYWIDEVERDSRWPLLRRGPF